MTQSLADVIPGPPVSRGPMESSRACARGLRRELSMPRRKMRSRVGSSEGLDATVGAGALDVVEAGVVCCAWNKAGTASSNSDVRLDMVTSRRLREAQRYARRLALVAFAVLAIPQSADTQTPRPTRRQPVTPELERTAFRDDGARVLLQRARAARLAQDSALVAYDANTYFRLSVGLGVR